MTMGKKRRRRRRQMRKRRRRTKCRRWKDVEGGGSESEGSSTQNWCERSDIIREANSTLPGYTIPIYQSRQHGGGQSPTGCARSISSRTMRWKTRSQRCDLSCSEKNPID